MTKKERAEVATSDSETVSDNKSGILVYKDSDADLGCGKPDTSASWKAEYRRQQACDTLRWLIGRR